MRRIVPANATWSEVNKKSRGGECIGPKARWHVCMKEQGTDTPIEGAENTFGTTVLLGCIWTCKTKNGAMSGEKMSNGEVIKFFSVIGLKMSNGAMKVGVDIGIK